MHHAFTMVLTLLALTLPTFTWAQVIETIPARDPIPLMSAPAPLVTEGVLAPGIRPSFRTTAGTFYPLSALELDRVGTSTTPSLSRHLWTGAGVGAAAGAAFGLWVISIADCGGPNCTTERVVGVAGNALGGAAIGALIGGMVYLIRR